MTSQGHGYQGGYNSRYERKAGFVCIEMVNIGEVQNENALLTTIHDTIAKSVQTPCQVNLVSDLYSPIDKRREYTDHSPRRRHKLQQNVQRSDRMLGSIIGGYFMDGDICSDDPLDIG